MKLLRSGVACLLLAGCSSLYDYQAPSYVVRSGDTLTSIAWRHGVDPRSLASWNNLANPDQLMVGQRLVLSPQAAGGNGTQPARPAAAASAATTTAPSAARAAVSASRPLWQWPVRGNIVARFGDRGVLSTGIRIAGRLGEDIQAAAAGRVMYAGSGLADYGQLIIIEHNADWLSAYGHNQRVLVSKGDLVSRGQKIAEMGPGPGGTPQLHFEIRRNGNPVDPLPLLPGSG